MRESYNGNQHTERAINSAMEGQNQVQKEDDN